MRIAKKAFTLAETLVALFISAVIGLAIVKLMSNAQFQAAKGRAKAVLRSNMKMAAAYLQRDIASSRVIFDKDQKKYKMTLELGAGASNPISKVETPKLKDGANPASQEDESISFFDYVDDENQAPDKKLFEEVNYSISNGVLFRNSEGKSQRIADHIESIDQSSSNDSGSDGAQLSYSGKIELTIKLKTKIEGSNEELELEEPLVISIRQLQNKINMSDEDPDNHWKQRIGKDNY